MAAALRLAGPWPIAGLQGCHSDVSISNDVFVNVYDASLSRNLWYTVGTFNEDDSSMEWGVTYSYGKGKQPSVALINKDEKCYAIEVHRSHLQKQCHYRIGEVNKDAKQIEWLGSEKDLCLGVKPRVSAIDSGKIVVVHEKIYSLNSRMQYHIGKLDISNGNPCEASIILSRSKVIVNGSCEALQGVEPDITISEDVVILIYRSGFNTICSNLGTFTEDDKVILWHDLQDVPGTGINPRISLNSGNYCVESHQTKFGRQISRNHGRISRHEIIWGNPTTATLGEYPSITLSNDGLVVELHKTCFGQKLYQSCGELKVRPTRTQNNGGL